LFVVTTDQLRFITQAYIYIWLCQCECNGRILRHSHALKRC